MNKLLRWAKRAAPYFGFAFLPYVLVLMNRATMPQAPVPPVVASMPVLMSVRRDASGETPVDVSPKTLRERWKLRRSAIPRWSRAEFGPFALRSDARADEARWVCYAVEWTWREVARQFGDVAPPGRVEVTAFAKWSEFQAYASVVGSEEAESYYDPNRREIVVCLEGRTPAQRFAAVVHEVTHAVQHAAAGRIESNWAAEGLADYMAATVLAQCGMTIEPDEDLTVRERHADLLPMPSLIHGDEKLFKARGATLVYSQSYSVVKFLIEERGMMPVEIGPWTPDAGEIRELEKEWKAWLNRADD